MRINVAALSVVAAITSASILSACTSIYTREFAVDAAQAMALSEQQQVFVAFRDFLASKGFRPSYDPGTEERARFVIGERPAEASRPSPLAYQDVLDGRIFLKGPPPKVQRLDGTIPSVPLKLSTPVMKVDVGPVWVVGEVSDARALAALKPEMSALAEWSLSLGVTGTTVFARSDESWSAIHVRSFAPAHGVPEDPVCGSGNLSVAVYLKDGKRFGSEYVARQGMQMGRDGRVAVRIREDHIQIGGHAVTCVEGTLAC